MKILYLNIGGAMGGAETSLLELLGGIRKARPDWSMKLLTGGDGALLEAAQAMGVETEVHALPAALAGVGDSNFLPGVGWWGKLRRIQSLVLATLAYGRQLARRTEEWQPDIIHVTGLKMQILAALYLRGSAKILWHIHDYVSWRPLAKKLLRLLAGRVDGALANSDSVAEDLRKSCPSLGWVERLYNAVDSEALNAEMAPDLDQAANVAAAPPGTLRIGLVATYAKWKGHIVFLDALRLLPKELPWRAYVAGGPIYKTAGSQHSTEELRQAIAERGLNDRVFLTGFLSQRGGIMQALDIVVHASTKPEPFGMVVIEAMACQRPVIVSAAGGAMEIFAEGKTGLGHKPGDAGDLARQMQRLLEDEALRQSLGRAGSQHVRENFSRERLAGQLIDCYTRMRGKR